MNPTLIRRSATTSFPARKQSRRSLPHLRALEAEAIHILRETAGQFERPILLIDAEEISVPPLYFAKARQVVDRRGTLIPVESGVRLLPGERATMKRCRLRSLGCTPCTGAIESDAATPGKIVEELTRSRRSERENRVIDYDQDGSTELKKREGYF